MKRCMLIIGIIVSLYALPTQAEQTKRHVYVERSNPTIGTKPHRSPAMLPSVEVVYDTDVNSIDVLCSFDCEAEVTVYDDGDNIVAISDINETIFVTDTNSSYLTVTVVAESWQGTAIIEF